MKENKLVSGELTLPTWAQVEEETEDYQHFQFNDHENFEKKLEEIRIKGIYLTISL